MLVLGPVCTYTSVTFIITIPRLQFTHTFEDETSHGAQAHCVVGNSIPRSVFSMDVQQRSSNRVLGRDSDDRS